VIFGEPPKDVSRLPYSPVGVSPDSRRVVIGGDKGAAKVWDSHTGKLVTMLVDARDSSSVRLAVFSPNGKTVLIGRGGVAVYRIVSSEDVDKFW